jgi:peptidase E
MLGRWHVHPDLRTLAGMKGSLVYLMAGAGPATSRRTVRYHRLLIRAIGAKRPRIAYVGAAASDSPRFLRFGRELLFGPSAELIAVELTKRANKTADVRAELDLADLIFFMGGDVERGMQLVDERGLAPHFRKLAAQGKPMEGVSAGSILLGKSWIRFSDDEDDPGERFACLGVTPFSFDTHAEDDDWEELRALARLLSGSAEKTVYGIPSGGCAVYRNGKVRALGKPLARFRSGDPARRMPDLPV